MQGQVSPCLTSLTSSLAHPDSLGGKDWALWKEGTQGMKKSGFSRVPGAV